MLHAARSRLEEDLLIWHKSKIVAIDLNGSKAEQQNIHLLGWPMKGRGVGVVNGAMPRSQNFCYIQRCNKNYSLGSLK